MGLLATVCLMNAYVYTADSTTRSVILVGAITSHAYYLVLIAASVWSSGWHPWIVWAATSLSNGVYAARHSGAVGLVLIAAVFAISGAVAVEAIRRFRVARSRYEADLQALDEANADVRKRLEEQSALFDVSQHLAATFDMAQLFQDAMECIARRLGMYRGTLSLYDAQAQELRVKHAYGLTLNEIETGRYRLGEGIYDTVMATGEPMAIPNLGEDPIFLHSAGHASGHETSDETGNESGNESAHESGYATAALGEKTRSIAFICMPIKMEGDTVGVLSVDRAPVDQRTLGDDLNFLAVLASIFAQALKIQQVVDAMVSQERLAVLGKMARSVAHEVRNPLAGIRGAAQLLAMGPTGDASSDLAESPDEARYADVIVQEVDRLNRVVEQLLHFGSWRPATPGPYDVIQIVDHVLLLVESVAESAGVRINRGFADGLPEALVDEDQITQVFLNVIRNGIEAMPDGGDLTVSANVAKSANTSFVEVRVSDSGVGLPKDGRDQIFDPLYTTKLKGTGIGLAIAKRLIEEHGGSVSVDDNVPHGTMVAIRLPVA